MYEMYPEIWPLGPDPAAGSGRPPRRRTRKPGPASSAVEPFGGPPVLEAASASPRAVSSG
ncbi:MAG: hypothetical protein ACLGIF_07785 [Actinomycetes bacterium]